MFVKFKLWSYLGSCIGSIRRRTVTTTLARDSHYQDEPSEAKSTPDGDTSDDSSDPTELGTDEVLAIEPERLVTFLRNGWKLRAPEVV